MRIPESTVQTGKRDTYQQQCLLVGNVDNRSDYTWGELALAAWQFYQRRHYIEQLGKCNKHLKEHMFRHIGVKPYACQHFSYSCSRPKGLKYHMLSHTGEKPFACRQCNYSCKQSRLLERHMRIHSEDKLNTCNQPEFVSSREDHLRMHLETKRV